MKINRDWTNQIDIWVVYIAGIQSFSAVLQGLKLCQGATELLA